MITVNLEGWKQFTEGLAREYYTLSQQNRSLPAGCSIRVYLDDQSNVVARMTTHDEHGTKDSLNSTQVFEVDQIYLDQVWFVYIPTDEEHETWSDYETENNHKGYMFEMIAQKEAQIKVGGRS